jgi:hypothetical protein
MKSALLMSIAIHMVALAAFALPSALNRPGN